MATDRPGADPRRGEERLAELTEREDRPPAGDERAGADPQRGRERTAGVPDTAEDPWTGEQRGARADRVEPRADQAGAREPVRTESPGVPPGPGGAGAGPAGEED